MWTSTVNLDPKRVLLTQVLGRIWQGAYFTSFAPLRVQNVPREPLPSTSWVRVHNRLAGISGHDLHLVHADGDFRVAPATLPTHGLIYPGDEATGEVIEIGDDVQELRVGDRVVLQAGPNCLSSGAQPLCRACAHGNYDLCEYGQQPGPSPIGGGWSEEMLLHEQQLFRVPSTLSDEQAILLKPTSIALHAVLRGLPQAGDRALIIGAGTIGLLTLQVLRLLTPQAEISVLARHSFQVEQATRMGATHIIYPQDTYNGVQRATHARLFNGLIGNQMLLGGYDVIFDTIGSRKTLHHALRWTRANGTIVLIGHSSHMMQIDLTPIWHQEINLFGSSGHSNELWPLGTQEQRSTMSIATELIERGQLHPEQLITHRFALNDYRSALTSAANKSQSRAIKAIFDFSLLPPSVVPNIRASLRRPTSDEQVTPPLATPVAFRSRQISQSEQSVQLPAFISNYADEVPVTPNIQRKPDLPLLLPEHDRTSFVTARRQPMFFEEESEVLPEDTSPAIPAVKRTTREQDAPLSAIDVEPPAQEPAQDAHALSDTPFTALNTSTENVLEEAPDTQGQPQQRPEQVLEPEATPTAEEPAQADGEGEPISHETPETTMVADKLLSSDTEQTPEDATVTEEPSPAPVEQATTAEVQTQDDVEQVPFPSEAEMQIHDAAEQVSLPPEAEVQIQDVTEEVPIPSEVRVQIQGDVEQVPFPSDFEGLPADVSEPAPWTWISYLEQEQIATTPAPVSIEATEELTQSATKPTPDALSSVEGSPTSEGAQRTSARKRSRKVTHQDKNA